MQEEEIGEIKSVQLGFEDHGIFTMGVQISFRGSGQGFGYYGLSKPIKKDNKTIGREGTVYGMTFIIKMLELFNIKDVKELVGQRVIAVREGDGFNELIVGLKTVPPDEERSFFPKEDLQQYIEEEENNK